ncbi:uncharacterized protein LOC106635842 [Copidosoma floridanum]|uniref:uncharacterized protein LOC106635842 n=1 Tax=Copidosoma floridanum TaxID=29053 RepID=UPI0006C9C304|nr:uncharacterized protein LOC106635842 [Copidosoma floridanum]
MLIPIFLCVAVAMSQAAPTTYDQRQEGDVNVKVDLDNFVILIARQVPTLDVFGTMSQLLLADSKHSQVDSESKTVPEDEVATKPVEEGNTEQETRTIGPVAGEGEKLLARGIEEAARKVKTPGKYKLVEAVEEPQSLKLVGDAVENCGPGRSRDRSGLCEEDIGN